LIGVFNTFRVRRRLTSHRLNDRQKFSPAAAGLAKNSQRRARFGAARAPSESLARTRSSMAGYVH